jgi:hypothetical protein
LPFWIRIQTTKINADPDPQHWKQASRKYKRLNFPFKSKCATVNKSTLCADMVRSKWLFTSCSNRILIPWLGDEVS